jgi:hypothetical protein
MKPKITVKGSKLTIASFDCEAAGKVSQKTIDLSDQAGEYVRIWLEKDKSYSTDKHRDHFWQVCELQVPDQAYTEVAGTDPETGEEIVTGEPVPIDLDKVEIRTFQLPK